MFPDPVKKFKSWVAFSGKILKAPSPSAQTQPLIFPNILNFELLDH
jgi:hypothetical protein